VSTPSLNPPYFLSNPPHPPPTPCQSALDVGGNNVGPDGAKALAAALGGNAALRSLELGYNPIGEAGAAAVAELLKRPDGGVETLKLGWCKVGGGAGARALADLVMFNQVRGWVVGWWGGCRWFGWLVDFINSLIN